MKKLIIVLALIPTLVIAEAKQEDQFDADAFLRKVTRQADFKEQETLVKQELKNHPKEIKLYLILGGIYNNWAKKDPAKYHDAEASYKKALQIEPNSLGARNGLGNVYFSTSQYDKAEKEFKKIISIDPHYAPVYINYGLLRAHQKQYKESIKYLGKAISLDPIMNEIDFVHLYLGDCYGWLKLDDKAIMEYEKVCKINPQYIQAHLHLGSLYGTKALQDKDLSYIDKARKHFDIVLELSPGNETAIRGLEMLKQARAKIQSSSSITLKSSGNVLIFAPKQYEKEAEGLKRELDKIKK